MAERKNKTYRLTWMALMTAVIAVLAPLSIPIGPVPVSFANLAIFLSVYLLGWKRGLGSVGCYLLLGLLGVPVFSGFTGGPGVILGATGGYLLGYLPMTLAAGITIAKTSRRSLQALGLFLGLLLCYAFGTGWYCILMKVTVKAALGTCVLIFLPGDLLKILAAVFVGPALKKHLHRAGVM